MDKYIQEEEEENKIIVPFTRIFNDNCHKLKYRKRIGEYKQPLHWGQRKLLLSEIEFLTLYGDRSNTVVYVGAADGKHILYLSKLFENHKFILYDPNNFDPCLSGVEKIEINQRLFGDVDAHLY